MALAAVCAAHLVLSAAVLRTVRLGAVPKGFVLAVVGRDVAVALTLVALGDPK